MSVKPDDDGRDPWLGGTRVLIADDNSDLLELLAGYLKSRGCTVDVATNGLEALRCAERAKPSIALFDIEMPGMDGYALVLHVRELPGWKDVPLIALTGHRDRYHWDEALTVGFTSYVTKPVNMLAAARLIERLCTQEHA
jgi:two-component system sensor histidine kinase BarA